MTEDDGVRGELRRIVRARVAALDRQRAPGRVARERLAVPAEKIGRRDIRLRPQRSEDLLGDVPIIKGERRGAVITDDLGDGAQIGDHLLPEGDDVIDDEGAAGDEEGAAADHHQDQRHPVPERNAAQEAHRCPS